MLWRFEADTGYPTSRFTSDFHACVRSSRSLFVTRPIVAEDLANIVRIRSDLCRVRLGQAILDVGKAMRKLFDALSAALAVLLVPCRRHQSAYYVQEHQNTPGDLRPDRESWRRVDPAKPSPIEKSALQVSVFVAALAAVGGGAWGIVTGLGQQASDIGSHERYLSGLLFGIGIAFWTTIPTIEHNTSRFRLLTALVVTGGLSRLAGVAMGDTVSVPTTIALAMELLVAPILCAWQARHASKSKEDLTERNTSRGDPLHCVPWSGSRWCRRATATRRSAHAQVGEAAARPRRGGPAVFEPRCSRMNFCTVSQ